MIRIRIGKIPNDILQTHILKLHLDTNSQYVPFYAIRAIESSPEVKSAMVKFNARLPDRTIFSAPMPHSFEGLPHLPAEITDVTVDQALDLVATTFKGIVSCGACTPPNTFEIYFRQPIR